MKTEKRDFNITGTENHKPALKKYAPPSLTEYGDIAELTQETAAAGPADTNFGHSATGTAPIRRIPHP